MIAFEETKSLYECTFGKDSPLNILGKIVLSPILLISIFSFFMFIFIFDILNLLFGKK